MAIDFQKLLKDEKGYYRYYPKYGTKIYCIQCQCIICGEVFWAQKGKRLRLFCKKHLFEFMRQQRVGKKHTISTKRKMSFAQKGEKSHRWKGGRTTYKKGGYVGILMEKSRYKNSRYYYEHRLVMEKMIGRELHRWEIVRHIDNNPQNNKEENLQLMTQARHIKLYKPHLKRRFQRCREQYV